MSLTVAVLLAATLGVGVGDDASAIAWEKDLRSASKNARQEQRILMIAFWADWCEWCRRLDTTTYVDPRVVEGARGMVAVKVDTEGSLGEMEAAEEYRVRKLPTIVFVAPSGTPVLRVEDFQDGGRFSETLAEAQRLGQRIAEAERILDRDSKDPVALATLGCHLVGLEDLDGGRELLTRSIRYDVGRPALERQETRRILGMVHILEEKDDDALRVLEDARALDPRSVLAPLILVEMGRLYLRSAQPADALHAFREAIAIDTVGDAAKDARLLIATLADGQN